MVAALAALIGVLLALAFVPAAAQVLAVLTILVLAAGFWRLQRPQHVVEVRQTLAEARTRWAELEKRWAPGPAARFAETRQVLAGLKREHDAMPDRRAHEMQGLAVDRRHEQLRAHLESCEIATAKVPGVGRAKVATLLSFGIETAADVDPARIAAVPGFGPKTAASLVAFRQACEASFRFDANRAVAPAQVAALDGMLGQRRAKIEAELAAGLAQLRAMATGERRHRAALEVSAAALRPIYAQALADARALGVR